MRPFCRILLLVVVLGLLTAPLIDARGKGKKRRNKTNRKKRQEELNVQPANEEPVQPANEEPVPPEEVLKNIYQIKSLTFKCNLIILSTRTLNISV